MTPQRIVHLLIGVTIAGLATAAVVALRAPDVDVPPHTVTLAPADTSAGSDVAVDSAVVDAVLDGNIFSPLRQRPAERTVLATDEPAGDSIVDDAGIMSDGDTTSAPLDGAASERVEDAVPRLYGVVDVGGRSAALLRLDRTRPGAVLYREGDRAGGFLVRRIESDRVALDGPRGSQWLRLAPRRSRP